MNPLVTKEIRLLLPGYVAALLLAIFSAWLSSWQIGDDQLPITMVLTPFWIGALMLALSSFGREFGMSTFPLLMAQPLTRSRIWWTKLIVLALAMATIFGACILFSMLWRQAQASHHVHLDGIGGTLNLVVAFMVVLASALWTSLLFRQIIAALLFALFIPIAIWTLISGFGGKALTIDIALACYSVASLWWAWHQFHRAQEVSWTGGTVALPEWKSSRINLKSANRTYHPIRALILKELKLHQVPLAGMAGLFLLHLGGVALRKALRDAPSDYNLLKDVLYGFPIFWVLAPLLTASLTVADERRLGTMEGNLCSPVSTRAQFTIKLLFALFFGGLLSSVLLWTAEAIGFAIDAGGGMGGIRMLVSGTGLGGLTAFFLALSFTSFYASTLARNLIQAITTAIFTPVVLTCIFALCLALPFFQSSRWGLLAVEAFLLFLVAAPTLIVTLLWLAYANFRSLHESRRLWSRNICTLVLTMLGVATVTTAVYNRAWEYLSPLEPSHGPAILSTSQPPVLDTASYRTSVLLPDGRFWRDHLVYDPGRPLLVIGDTPWLRLGGRWLGLKGDHFLNGSNWVAQASRFSETAAIQSDGTLWISQKRSPATGSKKNNRPFPKPLASLVRFGEDSDWKDVVRGPGYKDMVLLKTDGTLWRWGSNISDKKALIEVTPHQLGSDSDWTHILSVNSDLFAWKKSGEAWKMGITSPRPITPDTLIDREVVAQRSQVFDNMEWRSLAIYEPYGPLAVHKDGTLWANLSQPKPIQISESSNWVSVAACQYMLVALKSDGSLWKWDLENYWRGSNSFPFLEPPPTRLGTHHDWVALDGSNDSIVTLAADGTLWNWWNLNAFPSLLAPSRKPTRMANIFE